ncbi:hypothetical protein Tco_0386481 [Tanacetum coccineum]
MSSSNKSPRDYSQKHKRAILEPWKQSHNLPPSSPFPLLNRTTTTSHITINLLSSSLPPLSPSNSLPKSPPNSPIFDTTPLPPSPNSSNPTSSFLPPQISTQNHSENHLHELLHLSNLLDINVQHAIEYVVPTGRVVVPTGRYVVPAGKVIIIVSPGRLNLVPTGRILSPDDYGSDNNNSSDKVWENDSGGGVVVKISMLDKDGKILVVLVKMAVRPVVVLGRLELPVLRDQSKGGLRVKSLLAKNLGEAEVLDVPFSSSFFKKVSNGFDTSIWKYVWCFEGIRLMDQIPRLYALESNKDCKVWSWWRFDTTMSIPALSISVIAMGKIGNLGIEILNRVLHGVYLCVLWSIWKWQNNLVHASSESVESVRSFDIFPSFKRLSKVNSKKFWAAATTKDLDIDVTPEAVADALGEDHPNRALNLTLQ